MDRERDRDRRNSAIGWSILGGIGAAVGLGAAAAYYFSKKPSPELTAGHDERRATETVPQGDSSSPREPREPGANSSDDAITYISNLMSRVGVDNNYLEPHSSRARIGRIPDNPIINNMNSLLSDIYVRYVGIKKDDFTQHYKVFQYIFYDLHKKMKEVDKYYERYSSTVQFAGSHYDRLRIKKPDEFDMDVVIGMPLSIKNDMFNSGNSDFIIEPKEAGFVNLKMGPQYTNMPMRDSQDWVINKTAYSWKDSDNYLLRSKFTDWFKSVVVRALNQYKTNGLHPVYQIDGTDYTIQRSESGPAITLIIKNRSSNFRMDVDLVPALKFPEDRWPPRADYRQIPAQCAKGYWMVVPKPNKCDPSDIQKSRAWRIALHYQERELMSGSNHLRQAIRLVKKLRDAQGMDSIASYYIKTLVYWEIINQKNSTFWNQTPAVLFHLLVVKFYEAMEARSIPFFWNKQNNLLQGVNHTVLAGYARKLKKLIVILETPSEYKEAARFLLTPEEFREYNERFLRI